MFERLDAIVEKYEELSKELSSPEVLGDYNKLKKLSKEQKDLEETYNKYNEYKKVVSNLEEAEMLLDDPEMGEMAALEKEELSTKKEEKLTRTQELNTAKVQALKELGYKVESISININNESGQINRIVLSVRRIPLNLISGAYSQFPSKIKTFEKRASKNFFSSPRPE